MTDQEHEPLHEGLAEKTDIPYGEKNGIQLFADVIYPRERREVTLPVVIYIHGGGHIFGDRKANRIFCMNLAELGYIVFALEFRSLDKTDLFGIADDISDGLKMVEKDLIGFGGDPERIYIFGESSGAVSSICSAASSRSAAVRETFGFKDTKLSIKRMVIFSGMFYTARKDIIGLVYKKSLYGKKSKDKSFRRFTDLDSKDMLSLLPPILFVSSKGDFLRWYSVRYAKALHRSGHKYKFLYYRDRNDLFHAFPALMPDLSESRKVLTAIDAWLRNKDI